MRFIKAAPLVQSLATSVTTPAVDITHMDGYCWTVSWTDSGSLAGSYKVQVSPNAYVVDPPRNASGVAAENPLAVWVDLPDSAKAVTGSSAFMWNVDAPYYTGTRLVYTASAGAGSATVYLTARGVL